MPKIAITTTSFGEYDELPLNLCRQAGYEVSMNPYKRKVKGDEIIGLAKDAAGLIAGTESLTGDILKRLVKLKVISRCGAGMENVDLEAAKKLGVKVFNTPDAPSMAVAELTVGLILSLLRKTHEMDRAMRSGRWDKMMGNLLAGKNVGIMGFGRIGKKVAGLLKAFDCNIAYTDPLVQGKITGIKRLPGDELLKWADIVTVHAATKERVLGKKEIESMKDGAWIVNVSRGEGVDEKALYEHLKRGRLSGAALDVFEQEPYNGPLIELSNVILTPHIGSYAKEARIEMELQAVQNILKGLEGQR